MAAATDDDPLLEQLLRDAPARAFQRLSARDRLVEAAVAVSLVATVAAMAVLLHGHAETTETWAVVAVLGAVFAIAHRVQLTIGACTATPSELVVVPMLLLLRPELVPLLIAAGCLASRLPDYVRRRIHPDHALLVFGDAWHAVGPALVLALAHPGAPSLSHWPIYLGAFAAQLVMDNLTATVRLWFALGVPPQFQLRQSALIAAVDASLAPIGLLIAIAVHRTPAAIVLTVPLLVLFASFARERDRRISHMLDLSSAYSGSALLMGEMLEADDAYTGGEHTRGVVALSLAVGRELGLGARDQRNLEFASLLHDIGKLRVPDHIINKPGGLTDAEWAVIRRHPIDGQQMLDRIGGRLAEVGLVVRAHHERWDGGGYPDGLAGDAIPLAARIICACDALNAMTTDRSYRRAMTFDHALAELRRCAGSQFDPAVVDAVDRVVAAGAAARLVGSELAFDAQVPIAG